MTAWATLALHAANQAGIKVDDSVFTSARSSFDARTERTYGRVAYLYIGEGHYGSRPDPTWPVEYSSHIGTTAGANLCRILLGEEKNRPQDTSVMNMLVRDLPNWEKPSIDFHYWLWASLALFHYDGPSGATWKKWDKKMRSVLINHQDSKRKACSGGSWDPVGRWCSQGGRVYSTAMGALTLQTYYRYSLKSKK